MITARLNMSLATAPLPSTHPLRLEFCQSGGFVRAQLNHVHRKSTPFCILLTVMEGSYLLENEKHREMLLPGQVAFIPANRTTDFTHYCGAAGHMTASWLHFRFSLYGLVDYLQLFETPMIFNGKNGRKLSQLIQEMQQSEHGGLEAIARRHTLASSALECILEESTRLEDAWRCFEHTRLKAVLHYIHSNIHLPLNVDELATVANLSPSRFHVLFNHDFGCSPMRYVKRQRLEAAAQLLAGSTAKLSDIAEQTGFADAFHLSHAFKTHYGISPKNYRQQAKQ